MTNISPLHKLIGHKVVEFSYEVERKGALFDDGSSLTIYNQMSIQDIKARRNDFSVAEASVSSVCEASDFASIEFDNGIIWTIDLSDGAYSGPEAMQLNRVGDPIVVWRIGEG